MGIRKATSSVLTLASAAAALSLAHGQADSSADLARGKRVFDHWCAPCHADAPAMPGTQALQAKYDGALPAVLLERSDLTPAMIGFYVRNGVSVMPHFRKTEISDEDLAALSAYIVDTAAD